MELLVPKWEKMICKLGVIYWPRVCTSGQKVYSKTLVCTFGFHLCISGEEEKFFSTYAQNIL